MAKQPRILIAGGYGVFGRLLARELLSSMPVEVVIAGREVRRAAEACSELSGAEPLALDLTNLEEVSRAAAGCFAVVCAAGPFQSLNPGLPAAVAREGSHWLDISDFSGWVLPLLTNGAFHKIALTAGTVIMPGISTVPALSGALVRWGFNRIQEARRARVTLFIGNRNPKGAGAISSFLMSGFFDPVPVDLPVGRRFAYRFHSPDEALLRRELGLEGEFRVTFEWRLTSQVMALVHRAAPRRPRWQVLVARWLSALAAPFSRLGSDIGCLRAEVLSESGSGIACSLVGQGPRLAILPCILALEALRNGELKHRGIVNPATWLPADAWVERLCGRGIKFIEEGRINNWVVTAKKQSSKE